MERRKAELLLSIAEAKKIEAAEVFLRYSSSTTVEIKNQKVDAFERAGETGICIRVITGGGRVGFAYTTDLSEQSLKAMVERAVETSLYTEADKFLTIPERPSGSYLDTAIYDPEIASLSDREKIERVRAMEQEAYAVDRRIKRIRKALASFSETETLIVNSRGAMVSWHGTAAAASIEVVAEEGDDAQAGYEFDMRRFYRQLDIEDVGRRAARKAVDLLGARRIESVKAQVVLEPSVAQEFLEILKSGFLADNVQKNKSLFAGKLGSMVASPLITVFDDGLLEGGIGTAPADDEAVPMRTKKVIDKGSLALFLYNASAAKRDGVESTGNGVRSGIKSMPAVGITNLYIAPGTGSPDEIVASTHRGMLVNEIMGAHTANQISGDFSVGATGFWIEDGAKAFPVREVTIAGNILDVMKNVDAVGNDLRFSGRIGSPTLRISELSIAGK